MNSRGAQMIQVPFGNTFVTRMAPAMAPERYKTFQMRAPLSTHWRKGTCAEAECDAWLHGFEATVDESTDLGQRQAHYIRHDRSRKHTETRNAAGLTVFTFEAGQQGFAPDHDHPVRIERPFRYLVTGGDFRGNPRREAREHTRFEFWAEDMNDTLTAQKRAIEGSGI